MSLRVFVPKDSTAVALGADQVAGALAKIEDLRVIRTGSRGLYWLEPLVEIEAEGGRFGFSNVEDGADIAAILFRLRGNLTANYDPHKWCGFVDDLPALKGQERLLFARCGIDDPLDLDAYRRNGGFDAAQKALKQPRQAVIAELEASGLRGRGGAGFPAHIKWQTVADQDAPAKYVACNADEGDSGTFADRMMMEGDPFMLLEGMLLAGLTVGAETGYIYLRSEYPDAIKTVEAAIARLRAENWLGDNVQGSGRRFDIELRRGAGSYVCGEESAMLESLEGKRGQVRAKPPIPAISGLFGQPTLVQNVLSLASVPIIVARGGEAFAARGTGRSTGTQAFQLSGMVNQPGLFELPFGVTLGDLIEKFGGGMRSGSTFKAAQIGGPLGAYVTDLDVPLAYEELTAAGGMLGHGGVVVFDQSADMAQMARFAFEFCAVESCGKCTPCRVGAVRGVEVMDKMLAGTDHEANHALLNDLCDLMEDGSLCAMGGLTPLPVRSAMRHFPEEFGLARAAAE